MDNGISDGIRTDTAGNLWSSAGDGAHCFRAGVLGGNILASQMAANLTVDTPCRHRLFIAVTTSLDANNVTATGAQIS